MEDVISKIKSLLDNYSIVAYHSTIGKDSNLDIIEFVTRQGRFTIYVEKEIIDIFYTDISYPIGHPAFMQNKQYREVDSVLLLLKEKLDKL